MIPFSFHRILPLPSSDWVDAIGDFFCHTHSHGHHHGNETTVEPNAPSITPQENDLLVGNGWIVLRPNSFRKILRKKGVNVSVHVIRYNKILYSQLLDYRLACVFSSSHCDTFYHLPVCMGGPYKQNYIVIMSIALMC